MKPNTKFFILILFTLGVIKCVRAQWVQTGGPCGGSITALTIYTAKNGSTNIIAGTTSGIFLSSDNGKTWTPVGSSSISNYYLTGFPVSFLAPAPDSSGGTYLYAGFGGFGYGGGDIYRSDNDGSAWTFSGIGTGDSPTAFAVDTAGHGTILFAGTSQGVYISTDYGSNWAQVNNGLTSTDIKALAVAADGMGTTYLFAGTAGGIFVSTDSGAHWNLANTGLTHTEISAIGVIPDGSGGSTILAGTQYGGVFLSSNYGSNWTAATNSPNYVSSFTLATDGSGNTSVFTGGAGNGVFRSDNGGISWSKISNGIKGLDTYAGNSEVDIYSTAVSDNHTNNVRIFAGSGNGLYESDNNGSNWIESDAGITANSINSLTETTDGSGATSIFAGGSGIYRSTDNGANWIEVDNDLIQCLAVSPDGNGGNYIYAGTGNFNGVIRSDDNGSTWAPINKGMTGDHVLFIMTDDSVVLVGTYPQGFFISGNYGNDWSELISFHGFSYYAVETNVWNKYRNFLKSHFPQRMLSLAENDSSWASISHGISDYMDINSETISDSLLFVGTLSSGIYRLAGNDTNWTSIDNGLTNKYINCLTSYGHSAVFAGTYGGGVFLSTDNGGNWQTVNDGFSIDLDILALSISGNNSTSGPELFASTTSSGVWLRPVSDMVTSVKEPQKGEPAGFKLEQNYPNPFNPSTIITYTIPGNSYVNIRVYDMLGKEVSELVNGIKTAGKYSVQFNGTNLSSGVYFYSITALPINGTNKNYRQVRKMILIK